MNKIEIDVTKVLKGVIEVDGLLHDRIRRAVEDQIIEEVKAQVNDNFDRVRWTDEISSLKESVRLEVNQMMVAATKDIIRRFYEDTKYRGNDTKVMLERLKDFLDTAIRPGEVAVPAEPRVIIKKTRD